MIIGREDEEHEGILPCATQLNCRHVMQKIVYLCPPPFLRLIDGLTDEMHVACVPEF